jgi:ArsR family metal-binding transcriptional regulator
MEYRFQGVNEGQKPVGSNPEIQPDQPNDTQNNPEPPIVDPDTELPINLKYTYGECTTTGVDVLSCLNCKVKTESFEPDLSEKAKQLMMIMNSACKIKNKSDPQGKPVADSAAIFKYLSQANQTRYPDSLTSASQANLLKELSNEKSSMYKKLFGGLWYQPPYSDDFETYFGIATQEAKSLFCFQTEPSSFGLISYLPLQSKAYIDCLYGSSSFSCNEIPSYVEANKIRGQLQKAINYSLKNPFETGQPTPTNRCFWEKVEGEYNQEMEDIIVSWVNKGYKMAIYFDDVNPRCEQFKQLTSDLKGKLSAAAYICDDFEYSF